MDASLNRRMITPPTPTQQVKKSVYPWENTNLFILCQQLYELASHTGYLGSFAEFKEHFGVYLDSNPNLLNYDVYSGEYSITPLPNVDQILRTAHTLVMENIVVNQIPYYETSNDAGGYTVVIG